MPFPTRKRFFLHIMKNNSSRRKRMDIHKFIENLKKYLRTTFNYEISNNAIRVYLDNEIYYDYAYLSRKLYLYERGNKSEIGYWSDIKNANLNFAMLLRNHFCG